MTRSLEPHQVVLLLGTALVIGGVMVLVVVVLIRSLRRQRKEMKTATTAPRARDESAFMLASLQGLVAKMKSREKELEGLLRDAAQRAEASSRALEAIVRTTPQGLMVFDKEGFLTLANSPARAVLDVDTWSRRRYAEIFAADSPFAEAVRTCFEQGKAVQRAQLAYTSPSGRKAVLNLSLAPFHGRSGQLAGIVCVFAVLPPPAPR